MKKFEPGTFAFPDPDRDRAVVWDGGLGGIFNSASSSL